MPPGNCSTVTVGDFNVEESRAEVFTVDIRVLRYMARWDEQNKTLPKDPTQNRSVEDGLPQGPGDPHHAPRPIGYR